MNECDFQAFVRKTVAAHANAHFDKTDGKTINGGKKEAYVDAYKKWENFVVPLKEE